MTLQDLNDNYLAIDFFLSKSCNKSCYYCTTYTLEQRNLTVDLDFLVRVLEYFKKYKVRINLLGGEPALIKNLQQVTSEIQKYDNFVCCVLSNSLVRRKYPYILEDSKIFYFEHIVLDFYQDKIKKLGKFDFFAKNKNNNYNVVIKTPNYNKYRRNFPEEIAKLNHENTMFKEYNSRSPEYSVIYQSPEIDRRLCAKFPKVPVIDFENKSIRHCSKRTQDSRTFKVNQNNVDEMMNFKLFKYETYCETCCEKINNFSFNKYLDIIETHAI